MVRRDLILGFRLLEDGKKQSYVQQLDWQRRGRGGGVASDALSKSSSSNLSCTLNPRLSEFILILIRG